ncbi:MAG TPA: DUF6055 domain-containing protein [Polyangiaceae bacterium]|nr:DUF6055 domain-containing protein [Polyangiaceae bacterium]
MLAPRHFAALASTLTLLFGCGSSDSPNGASGGGPSGGSANAAANGGGAKGGASNGGSAGSGATSGTVSNGASAGSGATSGGTTNTGGSTGGTSGSGSGAGGAGNATGGSSTGGAAGMSTGGAANGGSANGAGTGGTSGSGPTGGCDPGTTTTTWAATCPTTAETCTAGEWVAGGPDPDHSSFTLRAESDHFAVYADESSTSSTTAQAAVTHLETVWKSYFGSPMYMREPLCTSATKYKASIHVHSDWGLTGGSWGTGRMGMWIGTGGLSDHWGLAHEFMHGVQSVSGGMACNQSNTCGWIYESHANWAAQQQSEYHTKDVHCSEMLANASHLYLGSTRDRYCNWQFMEYLKDKYCYSAVNSIWTGKATADPFTAIMSSQGWTIAELNDFFGEWAMHNVTWDYQEPAPSSTAGENQGALFRSKYGILTDTSKSERRLRLTELEPLELEHRRFVVPTLQAPQRWGYDIVRLYPDSGAASVTVTFRGVLQAAANTDFRWGIVATDAGITKPRYSALQKGTDGELEFCVGAGESLFLVVMATPSAMQQIVWDQLYPSIYRYPYLVGLENAWPEGYQGGVQAACPSGTERVTNGGGCGPASLPSSVYVGPFAQVLGGTVSGNARIDDHAVILSGTVSGGTVSGLSIVKSGMTISSGTEMLAWPYAAGTFESPQSLSGATLLGDLEYRGANLNKSSGTYCGFVDSGVNDNCGGADVTAPPPYVWR